MNVVLVERGELDAAGAVWLTDERARHLRTVLHATIGQVIRIGLVDGPLGVGAVMSIDDSGVRLSCEFDADIPAPPPVDLLLAVPRPKVLNRLWPQLAAIGVGSIILTNAERVERPYFDTHVLEPATWRPLLLEGLQQARDTRLPHVSVHRRFRPLIEDQLDSLSTAGVRLVADPSSRLSVREAISEARFISRRPREEARADRVLLAVGPEGGWNRFELDLLGFHGFVTVSMGPRTLRSDTACLALLTLVHDALRA